MPFSQESIDFLFENRIQNSKAWYEEHKEVYRRLVVDPMAELVAALTPTMQAIDPYFICEPKIGKTISRVYRDTRFSKDKSLYRDVAWCVFRRNRVLCPDYPAFFFEFSPGGMRYGCGYYETSPQIMERIRKLILAEDEAFTAVRTAYEKQDVFLLEDVRYRRSRFPDAPEELRKWLDLKSVCMAHSSMDRDLLFSDELWRHLAADFNRIAPFYRFLVKAVEQA